MSVRDLIAKAGLGGAYGGIKIDMPTDGGALDSVHILHDEVAGFAAIMKMFDSNPNVTLAERDYNGSGAWSTRAPMLALSNPDPALQLPAGVALQPKLFARNTLARIQRRSNCAFTGGTKRKMDASFCRRLL
jgi:hypothetical protein